MPIHQQSVRFGTISANLRSSSTVGDEKQTDGNEATLWTLLPAGAGEWLFLFQPDDHYQPHEQN